MGIERRTDGEILEGIFKSTWWPLLRFGRGGRSGAPVPLRLGYGRKPQFGGEDGVHLANVSTLKVLLGHSSGNV